MIEERDLGETQILAAFIGISEMIGNLPDLTEILRTVVRIAPQLVKVDRCAIFILDDGRKELIPLEVFCFDHSKIAPFRDLRLKLNDVPKLVSKVLRQKIPAVIRDVPQDDTLPEAVIRDLGIRSMLATPLIAKGEVRGIMTLDHSQARHYFTSKEINVVMGISNQLGLALENARLLKDIEAAEGRMGIGLDILSDGLISLAGDFTVELVSSKAVELLGIPPTIVGKPWIDVLTIKDEAGKELSEEDLVAMIPKNRDGFSDSRRIHLEVRGGKGLPFFLRLLSIPDRDRVGRVVLVLRKAPLPRGPPSLPPPPGEPVLDEAMQRF